MHRHKKKVLNEKFCRHKNSTGKMLQNTTNFNEALFTDVKKWYKTHNLILLKPCLQV